MPGRRYTCDAFGLLQVSVVMTASSRKESTSVLAAAVIPEVQIIEWEPTESGNVRVLNNTGDFYRFFDATPQAEFLYGCVQKTIEEELPNETEFLRRYDLFKSRTASMIDMPARIVDLLYRFLQQNGGHLSKRTRDLEFEALTDPEVEKIEILYGEVFGSLN